MTNLEMKLEIMIQAVHYIRKKEGEILRKINTTREDYFEEIKETHNPVEEAKIFVGDALQ